MLNVYRHAADVALISKLVDRLMADLSTVEPITLLVGPPQPSTHAVELWVDPVADGPWRELVSSVRSACSSMLGTDALPPVTSNGTPHTSIGYGIDDGDSGAIASKLKTIDPRPSLIEVPISEVRLLAVTQHPSQGKFTWDHVETFLLGPGSRAEQP